MRILLLMLLVSMNAFAGKNAAREPNDWSNDEKGRLVTSYKAAVTKFFLNEANQSDSVVQKDMKKVIADYNASPLGGCGGVSFPEKFSKEAITVVPYSYAGFEGRHCIGEKKANCDNQDDEGFLVLVPYMTSCRRTSLGSSLVYKVTYTPNFNGMKKEVFEGPIPVKIVAPEL